MDRIESLHHLLETASRMLSETPNTIANHNRRRFLAKTINDLSVKIDNLTKEKG